jgi:hypothetical protein
MARDTAVGMDRGDGVIGGCRANVCEDHEEDQRQKGVPNFAALDNFICREK